MQPMIYLAFAAFLVGSGAGFKAKSILAKAEQSTVLQVEREKLIKSEKINKSLNQELITAQAKTKIVYKAIIKRIPFYVTDKQKTDSECNITVGAKRLLNSINTLPETSIKPTNTDPRPSDIRTSDLIRYSAQTIQQYKLAQSQCNILIKWHQRND